MRARVAGLVKASHPGPCVAVTAVGTALGAEAGASARTCVLLAAALLTGQLSIGWANDAIDRDRDVAAGRPDKPAARGVVTQRTLGLAAAVAVVLCVPLSLALGWAAGLVHLVAVAGGWAYDLGLKRTVWSAVPFAVSFGLLPSVATLAAPARTFAPWWATLAGALLGVVAHLANTLPDIDDDRALGVLGMPQRLGRERSRTLAGVLLALAATVLALVPALAPATSAGNGHSGSHGTTLLAVLLLVAVVVLLAAAFVVRWPDRSRAPFVFTVGAALAVVGMLLAQGVSPDLTSGLDRIDGLATLWAVPRSPRARRRTSVPLLALLATLATVLLTACGSGLEAQTNQPYAPTLGSVTATQYLRVSNVVVVTDGTLAELYAGFVNVGTDVDAVTAVAVSDAGAMQLPAGDVPVPPYTNVTFGPSGTRVFVHDLTAKVGDVVTVSITFRDAGTVHLSALVTTQEGLTAGS